MHLKTKKDLLIIPNEIVDLNIITIAKVTSTISNYQVFLERNLEDIKYYEKK